MSTNWLSSRTLSLSGVLLLTALLLGVASAQTVEFGVGATGVGQQFNLAPSAWLRLANVRVGAGSASLSLRLGAVSSVALDLSANDSFGPLGNVIFEAGGVLRTDALAEGALGARGVLGPVALRVKLVAFNAAVAEFRPAELASAERPRFSAPTAGVQLGAVARLNRNLILEAEPELYWNRLGLALRSSATLRLLRLFGENELQLKVRGYATPGFSELEGAFGVGLLLPRGRAPDWSLAAYLGTGANGWAPGGELTLAEQFGSTRVNLTASVEPYRLDVEPLRLSAGLRTPLAGSGLGALSEAEIEFSAAVGADPFSRSDFGSEPFSGGTRAYFGVGVRLPF